MTHPAAHAAGVLRLRLLLALGLAAPPTACHGPGCEDPPHTATVSLDALADTGDTGWVAPETCPTDGYAIAELLWRSSKDECVQEILRATLQSQSGTDCTYEYTCFVCCGYGRPYLDEDGGPVEAEAVPTPGWAGGALTPRLGTLTPAERAAAGAYWSDNGRSEHSSVAGFHRFALDLLAHGAPPELLARSQRAAAQELRHALDCFALASAYLGTAIGPGPLEMGGRAVVAASLAELAAWTTRDGVVGETVAAFLAERALAEATDPAVRAALERIVRDETGHAELAWATVQWAIGRGGDEVRDAVRAVLAGLSDPVAPAVAWSPGLAAHGVPHPARAARDASICVREVVLPVAEALLAQVDAAA